MMAPRKTLMAQIEALRWKPRIAQVTE